MNSESLESIVNRVFFVGAFVLLALAILERVANSMGYTIILVTFRPGRLLEFSAILLLFVMTMMLRQIRQGLRTRSG